MNFLGPSLDKIPEGSSLTPADLSKCRIHVLNWYFTIVQSLNCLQLCCCLIFMFVDIMEARTQRMHEVGLYESSRPREQYR